MADLRQACRSRRELQNPATGTFSLAAQKVHEQSRGTISNAFPEALPEGLVGQFFCFDGGPVPNDAVHEFSVLRFSIRRFPAFEIRHFPPKSQMPPGKDPFPRASLDRDCPSGRTGERGIPRHDPLWSATVLAPKICRAPRPFPDMFRFSTAGTHVKWTGPCRKNLLSSFMPYTHPPGPSPEPDREEPRGAGWADPPAPRVPRIPPSTGSNRQRTRHLFPGVNPGGPPLRSLDPGPEETGNPGPDTKGAS